MAVELADAAGVELSLAVVAGAWLAVVSAGAGVALGSGVDGAEAIALLVLLSTLDAEGAALAVEASVPGVEGAMLGVEAIGLGAGVAAALGVLLVSAVSERCVSAVALAFAEDEREEVPRFERLDVLLLAAIFGAGFAAGTLSTGFGVAVASLRLGAGWAAAPASGTAGAGATSAEADVPGPGLFASATIAVRFADSGGVLSEPFRLWSSSSAPPITDAVMTPNAIPKWFMEPPD